LQRLPAAEELDELKRPQVLGLRDLCLELCARTSIPRLAQFSHWQTFLDLTQDPCDTETSAKCQQ